jgi:hypothetical protein
MKITSKNLTSIVIPLLAFVIMSMSTGNAYAHTMDVAGDYKIEIGWDEEPPIQGIKNSIELVITHATEEDKKNAEEMRAMMMGNDMNNQMSMGSTDVDSYDEKIIPILNKFDTNKITASSAVSQISQIINELNLEDDFGKEIASLIADVNSGIMTNEDVVFALIDMLGTELPKETNSMPAMGNMDMEHDETMSVEKDHGDEEGIPGLEKTVNVAVTLAGQTTSLKMDKTQVDGIYLGEFTPKSTGFPVVHISGMIHDTEVDLDMHPEEIESLSILPPLKQIKLGIDPSDVQCKEGLQLFMRTHVESAICASDALGQRLMEMGIVDFY